MTAPNKHMVFIKFTGPAAEEAREAFLAWFSDSGGEDGLCETCLANGVYVVDIEDDEGSIEIVTGDRETFYGER